MTRLTSELASLRNQISKAFKSLNDIRVGPIEAVCRNKLRLIEKDFMKFQDGFVSFENKLNDFLTKWFGPKVRFPDLGAQISLTLYYFSISNHRDCVRSMLQDVGRTLEDRRTRANNLLGLTISLIALLISTIAILV